MIAAALGAAPASAQHPLQRCVQLGVLAAAAARVLSKAATLALSFLTYQAVISHPAASSTLDAPARLQFFVCPTSSSRQAQAWHIAASAAAVLHLVQLMLSFKVSL